MRAAIVSFLAAAALAAACDGAEFGGRSDADSAPRSKPAVPNTPNDGEPRDEARRDGDDGLGGDGGLAGGDTDQPEGDGLVTPDAVGTLLSGDPKADAIGRCLAHWGDTARLGTEAVKNYRTMKASALGFTGAKIEDRTRTKGPRLVLIETAALGFSKVELILGNPNGFYCLKGANLGFSGRTVSKHCKAEITSDEVSNLGFASSDMSEFGSDCD